MTTKKLLVIHGFNSSPQSVKAQLIKAHFDRYFADIEVVCPQLKTTPQSAIAQLEGIIGEPNIDWYLIGSSLGGYFATHLSEKFNLPAALVNPAVRPYELLVDYIGEQVNPYTGQVYQVHPEHMEQLKALDTGAISGNNNFLVMVQTGDEVLDHKQAVSKYQNCQLVVQQGGDHSFINFEKMLPAIVKFFQLA